MGDPNNSYSVRADFSLRVQKKPEGSFRKKGHSKDKYRSGSQSEEAPLALDCPGLGKGWHLGEKRSGEKQRVQENGGDLPFSRGGDREG